MAAERIAVGQWVHTLEADPAWLEVGTSLSNKPHKTFSTAALKTFLSKTALPRYEPYRFYI